MRATCSAWGWMMADEFRAFEQKNSTRYVVHLFSGPEHFKTWCQAHWPQHMVAASAVRGVCERYPVDHRFENEQEIMEVQT